MMKMKKMKCTSKTVGTVKTIFPEAYASGNILRISCQPKVPKAPQGPKARQGPKAPHAPKGPSRPPQAPLALLTPKVPQGPQAREAQQEVEKPFCIFFRLVFPSAICMFASIPFAPFAM